ncbi:MAG: Tetratricopeptide 2 repeat protein [Myxococcales bacterium]|nr:Tetratricopeptide 2 repeat protein [Myxococcales bacterium]
MAANATQARELASDLLLFGGMRQIIQVVESDWADAATNIAPSQIEALLARAELAADPIVQATYLVEAATLCEAEAATDHAFLVRCTAYRVAPNAGARVELERLATLTGRLAELDELLTETTPGLPPDERAQASCDLGRLRLRRLRSPDRALEALDLSLALHDSGEAVMLRADALEELGRWTELATVLAGLAETARSAEEACRILMRLADALERGAGDSNGAEEVCLQALGLDRTHAGARARLERLCRARGDLGALLALVEDRVAITPPEQQEPLLRQAAELCVELGRHAEAADHYEDLRARHPGDLAPLRALERIYATDGRLRKQISVLEDLVGLVESKREHAAFHRKLAAAWSEVGEPARAIESFEWLLSYDPTEPVFDALKLLYVAESRYGALADAYARHLRAAEPSRRRTLRLELAMLYEQKLHDIGQAIGCWQAMLDDDERDAEALESLARLYESLEDFDRASQMVERWAALADGHERALRLSRAAEFTARLDDATRAHRLCERAFAADPSCLPARLGLAASHRRRGELSRADELIAAALAGKDAGSTELTCELAALREAEGDLAGALAQHRAILARTADDGAARRRACALALRLGLFAEALELAAPLPDDGPTELRLERWLLVSRAAHASGDRKLASDASARAAALAPDRLEVRRLRAEQLLLDGAAGEAEAIVTGLDAERDRMSLADRTALAYLAGECARARGDAETALARFHEAVALDPAHRLALRQSLDLSVELERWNDSVTALETLVSIERDRKIRARYRHLAGHVCEENLGDDDKALAHYRAALADDADHPRCAERIESLFRRRGDFAGLAEHAARALERLGEQGDVALRARLWSVLADAATGLGDRDGTIAALEVVARLDPRHYDARRRLASLHLQAGPDAADKAILAQHELLRLDPAYVPSYRALAALYERTGQIARGAACERAAQLLSSRDSDTAGGARAWSPAPELATRPLTAADWTLLQHPDEDRYVSLLAGLVAPLLAATAALPMDRARRWPGVPVPRNDMRPFVQAANHVARILGLPMPELFASNDQMAPMRFVWGSVKQAVRPVLVIGVPLLGDRRRMADLVPAVALDMAQLRPERNLRLFVHDPDVLALIMRAVMAVAHDEEPAPEAKVTAAALERWLPPVALDQLSVVGRRLREEGHDVTRLAAQWLRAADLTAARAALVLTGDLERTMAAVEARASDENAARGATRELIWASITDALWTVRDRIIAAGAPMAPRTAASV